MNRSKARGTAFETDVVDYLAPELPGVERRTLTGNKDKGDISGIYDWVAECKDEKKMNLAGAVDESLVEAENAHASWAVAIIKRPRKNVSMAYAVMTLKQYRDLMVVMARTLGPPEVRNSAVKVY
jgi:hypothetical protein